MPDDKKIIEPIKASFDAVSKAIVSVPIIETRQIFNATHAGDLKIGNLQLPCTIVGDGIRVLSNRGISTAFTGSRGGGLPAKDGAQNLPRFLSTKAIKSFISNDLMARLNEPIEYQPLHGGRTAFGYEATLLPEICEVIIDAERAGKLTDDNQIQAAHMLIRGFARVGIIALVDEATGYQEQRAKDALAKILEQYLSEELQKWTKTFPIEYYKEMFRLRGWEWKPWTVKKPSVVGTWTNDLVYERIAPGLLKELQHRNPKNEKGNRKDRHHQWFDPSNGHPELKAHITAVIALMKIAGTWKEFMRNMSVAFPKMNEQIPLSLPEPEHKV
jgi:hypothetical protein